MTTRIEAQPYSDRELVLSCLIDAPRDKVYRAWTDPTVLPRWFAPLPWTTARAELDVRAAGSNLVVMVSPEGEEFPSRGVYLDVVPFERLVITDAYTEAWQPSDKPFMTLELTFEDDEGQTRYTARVHHWSVVDREAHEAMGFHEGWGKATEQLEAVARSL